MATRTWMPVVLAVACLMLAAPADAVTVSPKQADAAFKQLDAYDYGKDLTPLFIIEAVIDQSSNDPKLRQSVTDRIVALVQNPKTKLSVKQFLCRQLERLATPKHMPLLRKLFDDPVTQEFARRVLEKVPGDEAAAVLRGGLAKCKGRTLIGCVNSLGVRRDPKAVADLAKLVTAKDAAVGQAAARALGKIGTTEAATALAKVKAKDARLADAVARARILCAWQFVKAGSTQQADAIFADMAGAKQPLKLRMVGLTGLVKLRKDKALPLVLDALESKNPVLQGTGAKLVAQLSGPVAAKALVARLPKLSPSAQALVIDSLAQWGGAEASKAMAGLLSSKNKAVRLAAMGGLAKLGGGASVDTLLKLAMSEDEEIQQAARAGLASLSGKGVNAKLLAAASAKAAYQTRVELLDVVVARQIDGAIPVLMKAATDGHHLVREAGFKGLRALVTAKDYPALIKLLVGAPTVRDIRAAQKAMLAAAKQIETTDGKLNPVLAAAKGVRPEVMVALLQAMGRFGGPKALAAIRGSLSDASPLVKDAAVRAIAGWQTADAAVDMLKLAKSAPNETHKLLALRGYMRLARQRAKQSPDASLKMLAEVKQVAKSAGVKRMLLAAVAELSDPGALAMASAFVGDEHVSAEATLATLQIAREVRKEHPEGVKAALAKVLKGSKNPDAIRQAKALLGQASFVTLFDGKTTKGWKKPFDWGKVTVEDGAIHLQGNKKFFLVTEKTYGDFVLELEGWLDKGANSGIQYRSHFKKNSLWGYQADVDSVPRGWRGIYDEGPGGRGWINRGDAKLAEKLYRKGWNSYRIECIGARTRFFMNGKMIVEHLDPNEIEGYIALQHHGEKGKVVRYRNIRIMDLGKRRWLPLVDEKTLATWKSNGNGKWAAEKGTIVGTKGDGGYGLLYSPREYTDFTVRFKVKIVRGNCGFYIRSEKLGAKGARGLAAEIDPNKDQSGLFETHGRNWVGKPDQAVVKKHFKKGAFNEMAICARGGHIVVHLNGYKTVELLNDKGRPKGYFGLGMHSGGARVEFRDVQILGD